jgi:hypothetical protein
MMHYELMSSQAAIDSEHVTTPQAAILHQIMRVLYSAVDERVTVEDFSTVAILRRLLAYRRGNWVPPLKEDRRVGELFTITTPSEIKAPRTRYWHQLPGRRLGVGDVIPDHNVH